MRASTTLREELRALEGLLGDAEIPWPKLVDKRRARVCTNKDKIR